MSYIMRNINFFVLLIAIIFAVIVIAFLFLVLWLCVKFPIVILLISVSAITVFIYLAIQERRKFRNLSNGKKDYISKH